VGWGHSSIGQLGALATMAEVRRLAPFHHDPSHDDDELDALQEEIADGAPSVQVVPGAEGVTYEVHHAA
jgi:ribonuclease BN (tRNA processing enzyme)